MNIIDWLLNLHPLAVAAVLMVACMAWVAVMVINVKVPEKDTSTSSGGDE